MKTVNYKGYQASVDFDDGVLFVKILHIDDLLIGQCNQASEAQQVAADLVEAYLEDCAEAGREPTRPFKGTFNVRMSPDVHRRAARSAAEEGMTLNSWVSEAVAEKLECDKFAERIDGVFTKKYVEMSAVAIEQWIQTRAVAPEFKDHKHVDLRFEDGGERVVSLDLFRRVAVDRVKNYG